MRKVTYIILRGHPRSGRTTVARELTRELAAVEDGNGVIQDSFCAPLKHFFAVALGDKFQSMNKELQRPELNGRSLRSAWLSMQEYAKDQYGPDCFARWVISRTLRNPQRLPIYVIIDDGVGNPYEVSPFDNCVPVWIWRDPHYARPNEGLTVANTGTIIDLFTNVRALANTIKSRTNVQEA